jgi:hypothetical protein
MSNQNGREDLSSLSNDEQTARRREWNRGPLKDLFPRIPDFVLKRILDICIEKNFIYNLSESKHWNARRYTSIVIAHVRHNHTNYDELLRVQHLERFEARQQTSKQVWKVLREWCPWNDSNEVLERCFQATLVRRENRDPEWDPMDIDDSDYEANADGDDDDPMDLD